MSVPPFTPKNREQKERLFLQTEKRGENEERNIFFAEERREKSLNFFFRTEQTAKEGDSSGVFFGEETKKDEFYRFLERDISWNIFIVFKRHFPSTRAKNNNTRVLERKETRKTRRKK